MDNFHIDVISEGDIASAMAIAFREGTRAVAYRVDKEKGLIFYSYISDSARSAAVPLPFRLDAAGAADFAKRWLEEQDYGEEPDHDGDNGKGWRVYTEGWGMVAGEQSAFVAIKPAWAMYGK